MTSPVDPATSAAELHGLAGFEPLTPASAGALTRYRVIAYIVGVMLLVLLFVGDAAQVPRRQSRAR